MVTKGKSCQVIVSEATCREITHLNEAFTSLAAVFVNKINVTD